MKKPLSLILVIIISLIMLSAGSSLAITVTASPNPATVGQNVLVSSTSVFSVVPVCPMEVNFGDGGWQTLGTCTSSLLCNLSTSHMYSTSGVYTISVRHQAGLCTNPPLAPNPGTTSLTVNCSALTLLTPSSLPSGTTGQAYSASLQTSGGQVPVNFSLSSGSLPPGLSLSSAGFISGTPTTAGTFSFLVSATDSCSLGTQNTFKSFTITVTAPICPALSITSPATLTAGNVIQQYSYQLQTSGGVAPVSFTLMSGSLPPGVVLSTSGLLSGTPTTAGTYSFLIRAMDTCSSGAQSVLQSFTITIAPATCPALSITSPASLASGTVNQIYSYQLQTSGGVVPVSFTLSSGSLPPGLTLSAGGLISGTATTAGTYSFLISATDSCSSGAQNAQKSFAITITPITCPSFSIASPATLTPGTVTQPYSFQLLTSGGQTPVTFSQIGGTLPSGLTLNATGLISGSPTTPGNYSFRVRATDSCPAGVQTAEQTFSMQVQTSAITLTVVPPALAVARGSSSSTNITYQFNSQSNATFTSPAGSFIVGAEVIGTNPNNLTANIHSGTSSIFEIINIPVAIIERAIQRRSNSFAYVRTFSNSSISLTASVLVTITTAAGASFDVQRIELYFENRRAEITIPRNYPHLKAFADVRFTGSGLLHGYWEVDGQLIWPVDQHIVFGNTYTFQTPEIPPLPTFDEGYHTVRFVITNPLTGISMPTAVYFVTAEETQWKPAPIKLLSPQNTSMIEYAPSKFDWEKAADIPLFFIQYFRSSDTIPVFSAYAKDAFYTIPEPVMKNSFVAGEDYSWKVIAFDADRNIVGESELWNFTFNMPAEHVKGQIVTVFPDATSPETLVNDLAIRHKLKTIDVFPLKSLDLSLALFETSETALFSLIEELKKDKRVLIVQPNYIFRTLRDPMRNMQSGNDTLRVDKLHAISTGQGIKVAVIDTGIDVEHEDLRGRVSFAENYMRGEKYVSEIHGTGVAGLIGAAINGVGIEGVAPGADILGLRACRQVSNENPEGECYTESLAKALDRAIEQKAHIVNMSFGITAFDGILAKLIDKGTDQGMLFVAPAGNLKNARELPFPASHPSVLAVGGIDERLKPYPNAEIAKKAGVCAPSSHIFSTVPGNKYNFIDGTSMSSAYISGVLALALEKNKSITRKSLPIYDGDLCKWEEKLMSKKLCGE